jgi:hypothetical protein
MTFHARSTSLSALLLASLASVAYAQDAGAPSLFPLPPVTKTYPVSQTTATDALWYQGEQSPARPVAPNPGAAALPAPSLPSAPSTGEPHVISPDYQAAMKGGWEGGCTTCCDDCGCGHYIYANALIMTHDKRGGFVTSVDSATGDPAVLFCNPEFGRLWHGGFEIGGGWCFGCGCRHALEVVYWGLYPAEASARATGTLDSMIDFSDLDYAGGNADLFFDGAAAHRVTYDFDFHSVEVNLVGNCCSGGPFGCGMCGCCNGNSGSPWGFGWLAGFRYINFTEDWLFTTDTTETVFDNDATELNYSVDTDNNLFGFQLGGGISYCITNALSAYATAKFGLYNNHIEQTQRVFGPLGNATINNGPFATSDYVIDAEDDDIAFVGQIDVGARWALNQSWSLNAGYRLLALSGVAISEDNVAQGNFQNVLGIADTQTTGTFIMHGAVLGATYCW